MASWKPVGWLKKLLVSTEKKEKIVIQIFFRIYVQSVSVAEKVGTAAEMRRLSSRRQCLMLSRKLLKSFPDGTLRFL